MRRAITITTILFLLLVLVTGTGGCEFHSYPHEEVYFPAPTHSIVIAYDDYYYDDYYYDDYCYELPFDYCCAYYEYYDRPFTNSYEVCKITDCMDYHTNEWYFEGEECWHEQ